MSTNEPDLTALEPVIKRYENIAQANKNPYAKSVRLESLPTLRDARRYRAHITLATRLYNVRFSTPTPLSWSQMGAIIGVVSGAFLHTLGTRRGYAAESTFIEIHKQLCHIEKYLGLPQVSQENPARNGYLCR